MKLREDAGKCSHPRAYARGSPAGLERAEASKRAYEQEIAKRIDRIRAAAREKKEKYRKERTRTIERAKRLEIPLEIELSQGRVARLSRFNENGMPYYVSAQNESSADMINTNELWGITYNLDGFDQAIGIWEVDGRPLPTHQEFGGTNFSRVSWEDTASASRVTPDDHATHVAGTMIAEGVQDGAQGMAPAAELFAWDSEGDAGEMDDAFTTLDLKLSNHSYGFPAGWECSGGTGPNCSGGTWYWMGDQGINSIEDHRFGLYTEEAHEWDDLTERNPFYLIVTSAGNDRNDGPSSQPTQHMVQDPATDNWVQSKMSRDLDCQSGPGSGYDCVQHGAIAKNVLTVGALSDDGTTPTSFSAFGPTDDGRIKPDVMADGWQVYSAAAQSNSSYGYSSGTSHAAPAVTGTIALLKELASPMELRASTLKSLVLHTADDIGPPGPDYKTGWGRMNAERAAEIIQDEIDAGSDTLHIVNNTTLGDGKTTEFSITTPSNPDTLRATIAWTDPAPTLAALPSNQLDPSDQMLINDLNLRVIRDNDGQVHQPFVLDPTNPSVDATSGNNDRDNVEHVLIPEPVPNETYTIRVSHSGSLGGTSQDFSLITTGNDGLTLTLGGEGGDGDGGGGYCSGKYKQLPEEITSDYTVPEDVKCYSPGTVVKNGATLKVKWDATLEFPDTGSLRIAPGAKLKAWGALFTGMYGDGWGNIVVRGDSSVLSNVEIRSAGVGCPSSCPALEIAANGVELTNAHIHDNAHAGIGATETDPYQSSTFTLTNSTLRGNGGDGLKASWSNMTLNGNTIRNNAGTGVSLEGYIGADIQHNEIRANGGDGVYTGYTVSVDLFENNSIHNNGSSGIDTQASQLYAAGDASNEIYNNGGHEIIVRGNSPGVNLGDASAGEEGKNRIYHTTADGLGYIYGPGERYIKNTSSATVDAEGNYWHREGAYGGQEPEPAMFSGDVNYGQSATEELTVSMNCLPGNPGKVVCTAYPYGGAGDFTYIWSFGQSSQDGKKCQVSCDQDYGGRTLTVTVVDAQGNYATATGDHACVTNTGTSAYASLDQSALRSDVDSLSASLQSNGSENTSASTRTHGSLSATNAASAGPQSTRAELPRRTVDAETLRRVYLLQRLNARVDQVRSGNRSARTHPFESTRGRRVHALMTRFAEADPGARSHIRPEVRTAARELLVENRLRTGKPDKALQRAKKYLDDAESPEERAQMQLMKARALGQQGNLDRALTTIDRAEELLPDGNEYTSVRISVLRSNDDARWKESAERQQAIATNAADRRDRTSKNAQPQRAEEQALPEEFALRAPYPNPSSGQVTVPLALPERARVNATVYDMLGRRVQTLAADRSFTAGHETLSFSADGIPNGVYLIRLRVAASDETHSFTEKVTVVR